MWIQKRGAVLLLFLLILSGCAEPAAPVPEPAHEEVSIAAQFQTENGDLLQDGAAQFSVDPEKNSGSCPLDSNGAVSVSGLPRNGELLLTVFDRQQRVQGTMTLSFSEGAVIDATTGEDGVGHVTIRNDTDEVSLAFVLGENGAIQCRLWLAEDSPSHGDVLQKGV